MRLPSWPRTALTLTLTLTRSDAFDALHLEYTVHLLTTWRKVRVRVWVRDKVWARVRVTGRIRDRGRGGF